MKCIKCKSTMIPIGSPAQRKKQGYTVYACPKCGNAAGVVKLRGNRR